MSAAVLYIQICISAPSDELSGTVVAQWIDRVVTPRNLPWVAVTDVDIAGDVRPELSITAHGVRVMETGTLLSLLQRAVQIVWASLFFCASRSDAETIRADEPYEASTAKATVTVRVVDASYVYIMGQEDVLRGVDVVLPPGAVRIGSLEDLEFPE